jgi:hypothetical protein
MCVVELALAVQNQIMALMGPRIKPQPFVHSKAMKGGFASGEAREQSNWLAHGSDVD